MVRDHPVTVNFASLYCFASINRSISSLTVEVAAGAKRIKFGDYKNRTIDLESKLLKYGGNFDNSQKYADTKSPTTVNRKESSIIGSVGTDVCENITLEDLLAYPQYIIKRYCDIHRPTNEKDTPRWSSWNSSTVKAEYASLWSSVFVSQSRESRHLFSFMVYKFYIAYYCQSHFTGFVSFSIL